MEPYDARVSRTVLEGGSSHPTRTVLSIISKFYKLLLIVKREYISMKEANIL